MRHLIADIWSWLRRRLRPRALPPALAGGSWAPLTPEPRRQRPPTPAEALAELRSTAWACASLNAAVCASFPPKLYAGTRPGEQSPRCLTRPLSRAQERGLRAAPHLLAHTRAVDHIEEVTDHPLLSLLEQVNPVHNSFDLWELTTLYQEVVGSAYWLLDLDPLGVPRAIWPLPAQNVTPARAPNSPNLVDAYVYRTGSAEQRFDPGRVIAFRYPDPRDPYARGLAPLTACFEQVRLSGDFTAFKRGKFENHALPDAIVSPEEVLGEEERDRLETQWNARFRRGGGRVVVAESALRVQLLAHSLGDVAALADLRATREDIAACFHVPLAFLTTETNLANLQAAEHQHMAKAVRPRLRRRDEKLNEQLVPLFDPGRRLFLASEDPVPADRDLSARERELDLKYGVVTVNEVRNERGLPPVPWGNTPFVPRSGATGGPSQPADAAPGSTD
jgi:HK97 family phage portal protein